MPPRVNWSLVVSVFALLVMTLGAIIAHIVMTERRLAVLETQVMECVDRKAP